MLYITDTIESSEDPPTWKWIVLNSYMQYMQ